VGRQAFLDPQRGRCNVCHLNAGANSQDTGKNRNFNTGMVRITGGTIGSVDGLPFFDGGFGLDPFDALQLGFPNSAGNGSFNTPPLIEAADTPPFFHNNDLGSGASIETAVFFYTDPFPFPTSPAAQELQARFGTPIQFSTADGFAIARFLRALNAAFNMDIAKQRLRAALTLNNDKSAKAREIQLRLLQLADVEIDDAIHVLQTAPNLPPAPTAPLYPLSVDRLNLAKAEIAAAIAAPADNRGGRISNAVSRVENGRDPIGSNINFNLGSGNLFFEP
jgi:hypothetical protein